MSTTKTYTQAANTSRAAKGQLAKQLGLTAKEVVKGEHFQVKPVDGGFVWRPIIKKVKVARRTVAVEAPVAAAPKAEGIKIQKDREERNGIKRPSVGGKCALLWDIFEKHYKETGMILTPKPAKELSAKEDLDPTTTTVQLYRWRDFMGF